MNPFPVCPVCKNNYKVGKYSCNQYFCMDCNIQFVVRKNYIAVYVCMEDGDLELIHLEVKGCGESGYS